jgi:chemotaxis family two-component system response regulator PixG
MKTLVMADKHRPILTPSERPAKEGLSGVGMVKELLKIKQEQLSGILTIESPDQVWTLYLYLGRILYAAGGQHSIRRWQYNLKRFCPSLEQELESVSIEMLREAFPESVCCPHYQFICLLAKQGILSREQTQTIIRNLCTDSLFDIARANHLRFHLNQTGSLAPRLTVLSISELLDGIHSELALWQTLGLNPVYLDQMPHLDLPEVLEGQVPKPIFAQWQKVFQSQQTLRELAVTLGKKPTEIGRLLMPLLRQGIVSMQPVSEVQSPWIEDPHSEDLATKPLIACIDDSEIVCETIKRILTPEGYRFLGIQDPLRAIAQVLSQPPDLIFLDLVMPSSNGYEICTQLRKVPRFRETPIIILTGNDGIIDRVRAKLVGSTHFMNKPVQKEELLQTIQTYLTVKHSA